MLPVSSHFSLEPERRESSSISNTDDARVSRPDDYYPIDYLKAEVDYHLSMYSEDRLMKVGHQLKSLLHSCAFKQSKCTR